MHDIALVSLEMDFLPVARARKFESPGVPHGLCFSLTAAHVWIRPSASSYEGNFQYRRTHLQGGASDR